MKLIIKEGESVDNALQYLQDFLGQYKNDYPILKGNMNVYVTLEGFGHRACPENDQELILTGDDPFDLYEYRKGLALDETLKRWRGVLSRNARDIKDAQIDIQRDKEYLATAEEKGKRPDLIEKRKKQLAGNEEELEALTERYLLLNRFDKALGDGRATLCFAKNTRGKATYNYDLECTIVFDNIDGLYGYCNRYGFNTGLPNGYKTRG